MCLIFLQHDYSRFVRVKAEIEETLPSHGDVKRALVKEDFSQRGSIFLKPEAQFDYSSQSRMAEIGPVPSSPRWKALRLTTNR